MNKMLVAVFDTESAAYEGLSALKDLHRDGDITLYASAVVSKDPTGAVSVKESAEPLPLGTPIGLMTGSLLGVVGGPVGVAVGAGLGSLTGLAIDLNESEIDFGFLNEVSNAIIPGKVAVLADVEESWVAPVDTRLEKLGGLVFRRLRSEVVEDQLARESAEFEAEMKQLRDELANARAEDKAEVQMKIDAVRKKLEVTREQARGRAEQAKSEFDAKVAAMRDQRELANKRRKARIEKRMADVEADYTERRAKLEKVEERAEKALDLVGEVS